MPQSTATTKKKSRSCVLASVISSGIGYLCEAIREKVPTASVLLTKVLYSGSHCGDSLTREEVRLAKRELEEVAIKLADDASVQAFVVTFGGIVDVALRHERPVTF